MRLVNRIASALLGLALLGLGLLVVVQAVVLWRGRPPWWVPVDRWRDWLARLPLSDWRVLTASIAALVVGGLIVVLELRPRRPDHLAVGEDAQTDWWLTRRSVERRAAAAAETVDEVVAAKATARGRPGRWRLAVTAHLVADDASRATTTGAATTGAATTGAATTGAAVHGHAAQSSAAMSSAGNGGTGSGRHGPVEAPAIAAAVQRSVRAELGRLLVPDRVPVAATLKRRKS